MLIVADSPEHMIRRLLPLALASAFGALSSLTADAATVSVKTITVGIHPVAAALNASTGKLYILNMCGADSTCASNGSVTVIDSSSDTVSGSALPVGRLPYAIAVNPVTNKVYVANKSSNSISIIDGSTNAITSVAVGAYPYALAINTKTNRVYTVNVSGGTVSVVDGTSATVMATIPVGSSPIGIAVNEQSNRIYVTNSTNGTVTVIDGSNNSVIANARTGISPMGIAVNPVTNQVYIANSGSGTLTIVDGSTNSTSSVAVGVYPIALVVNPSGNKIYAVNYATKGTLAVLDGASLELASVSVGALPTGVAADASFQSIYVANSSDNTVTIVNGATNGTSSIPVGASPRSIVVNSASGEAYVLNYSGNSVSVISGASDPPDPPPSGLRFVPVTPCRLVDTRKANGAFGSPAVSGKNTRSFPIPQSSCAIPPTAAAYSLNVTVVPHGPLGFLTIWPTGPSMPTASTLNSWDGRVKANAAIVGAGSDGQGSVSVFASDTTDIILDINGYFTPDTSALEFFPIAPCRVVDTRKAGMGAPSLAASESRAFSMRSQTCNIPASAQAYSLNVTAVPHAPLGYLSAWPSDQAQPNVSTLNSYSGTVVANAAIVPASQVDGSINVFVSSAADVIMDVNGYFASAASGSSGLSLYAVNVCRMLDTRSTVNYLNGTLKVSESGGACPALSAQALVMNATAIPSATLGFLSLWADGVSQTNASTLNSFDGAIASNMAVVPIQNGVIDAFTSNPAQLILDMSGYFAP